MERKHVLVTGGAAGLGLGCVQRFCELGFDVTIADIDQGGALEAARAASLRVPGAVVHAEHVNLAEPESIAALAARLLAQDRPLHVLVNNAGIYPPSSRALSIEGHELTFAIAYLGHFRLTHALWPLLSEARKARVVSVSSITQRRATLILHDLSFEKGYTPIRAYAQAKLATLLFALELQRRIDACSSPVASYAAHPGVCRTQIARNRRTSPDDHWWQRVSTAAFRFGMGRFGLSPEEGALPVVAAAVDEDLKPGAFIGPTGFLEMSGPLGPARPGRAACDPALGAALWERTEALTGIRWMH